MAKSSPLPGFANKVLLAHGHVPHLHLVCGCVHTTVAELNSCYGNCMARKAENIYSWDLYRQSLQTPDVVYSTHFTYGECVSQRRGFANT